MQNTNTNADSIPNAILLACAQDLLEDQKPQEVVISENDVYAEAFQVMSELGA